tara:strand:- start:12177 stop:13322 length:1146 start_codon:yes stop_codon:yes gene_type:complete
MAEAFDDDEDFSTSSAGSSPSGAGNFVVNPLTGYVLKIILSNGKENKTYTQLLLDGYGDQMMRYQSEDDAKTAAKTARASKSGKKAKMYLFNPASGQVRQVSAGTSGAFRTKKEAQDDAFKRELLKTKPTSKKTKSDAENDPRMHHYISTDNVQPAGKTARLEKKLTWYVSKNAKGEYTTAYNTYKKLTGKAPKMYTSLEKFEMSKERNSSSSRPAKQVSPGALERAKKDARARGATEESIRKAIKVVDKNGKKRTDAQLVSALKLLNSAGVGALICVKRAYIGPDGKPGKNPNNKTSFEAGARNLTILKKDRTMGSGAAVLAKEYYRLAKKEVPKGAMSDSKIKSAIKASVNAGFLIQVAGTGGDSRCADRKGLLKVSAW